MKSTLSSGFFRLFFLVFLLCGIVPVISYAQSAALIQMASGELQKRGLSEDEVRVRLLEEGIDVEGISPSEYPQYQSRVMAVINKMEAEKKSAAQSNAQPIVINTAAPAAKGEEPVSSVSTVSDIPETTIQEAQAEATQRVIQSESDGGPGARIYGHSMFTDKTLDIFRTTDGAQAPDTYVLGEGDEIHVTIFGASQTEIQQRIAADGSIQPAGTARIFLKGLTLAQAREVIRTSLSAAYSFRNDQLAVTIVTARTIMVNIFGEVNVSGGFSISALNSAFNALSAAGGPTAIGSVRNIQLVRGNSRKSIDVYAFMKKPETQFKFDLQNNDILFVPVAQKLVSIEGAVKRPMTYEMLEKEDLKTLIDFAGGLTRNVYPDFVQIERYVNGEVKLYEWNLSDVMTGKSKVDLMDGDAVRIRTISKPMDTYVRIEGSVYYPGRFDLESNKSLQGLLNTAKPTFEAKTDFVFVERTRPDETTEYITVPYPGLNGAADFTLQERDVVRVMSQSTYRDVATISVNGQVRQPFTRNYALNDRMTVAQAIEYAGGLRESVYPVAYIFRKNLMNPVETQYIRIELESDGDTYLQPGDQLNVYDNTTYTNVGEVSIYGAVKNPRAVSYDSSLSVHDLLTMAGGFEVGAAFDKVEVFRTVLSATEQTKLEMITLAVDSAFNILQPANFVLQPYDHIVVRMTPEFTMGRTVEINGRVKYPGTYVLESRQTQLSEIIEMAGGLLDDADPFGARLFRTFNNRGSVSMELGKVIKHKGNLKYDPILFQGDVINIVSQENVITIRETGTRMSQYAAADYSNTDQKTIIYQGGHSAAWYIRNHAGGFVKNADKNSVTVTLPNNQMVSTKRFLGFRNYPTVESGAVITLRMDVEKVEKDLKPKEKIDWDSVLAKSLTTLTSAISIAAIISRL